jgi:hypothetical protein
MTARTATGAAAGLIGQQALAPGAKGYATFLWTRPESKPRARAVNFQQRQPGKAVSA